MATPVGIAYYDGGKHIVSVVDFDGYFSYVGLLLLLHYNTSIQASHIADIGHMVGLKTSYSETLRKVKEGSKADVLGDRTDLLNYMKDKDLDGIYVYRNLKGVTNENEKGWYYITYDGSERKSKDVLQYLTDTPLITKEMTKEEIYKYLESLPKIDSKISKEVKECLARIITNL